MLLARSVLHCMNANIYVVGGKRLNADNHKGGSLSKIKYL